MEIKIIDEKIYEVKEIDVISETEKIQKEIELFQKAIKLLEEKITKLNFFK